MSKLDELIQEIRLMNENIRQLIRSQQSQSKTLYKIPRAAMMLGVSPALLRKLCKKGTVPCSTTNNNPTNKHYIVDIDEARLALAAGGYLYSTPPKRGPKPLTQII